MRILMAVHHFPPTHYAGAEREAFRIARGLKDRGHEVFVITVASITSGPEEGASFQDTVHEGLPVRRLSFRLAQSPDPVRFEYDNPWTAEQVTAYIDECAPDVFFLVSGYLMTGSVVRAAKTAGLPVIVYPTEFWFVCWRQMKVKTNGEICPFPITDADCAQCLGEMQRRYRIPGTWFPGLMRQYWRGRTKEVAQMTRRRTTLMADLNMADMVIPQSLFTGEKLVASGLAPGKVTYSRNGQVIIPHTLDLTERFPNRRPFHLGFTGQIAPHKGVHLLSEALRLVPGLEIEVNVYGNGKVYPTYTRGLRRYSERDPRFRLRGAYTSKEEFLKVMSNQDAMVVPSVCYENSPNAILEPHMFHMPVIAANHGGMAELVRDGVDGLLFAPGDARDLAQQMEKIATNAALYQDLCRGVEPVKSIAAQLDELEGVLGKLVHPAKTVSQVDPGCD